MIKLVEALNYRCLRYIRQPLSNFHVLIGPNASGKTTFLDVVGFLSDFVSSGLQEALEKRSPNFQDLLFGREGDRFELAIECDLPETLENHPAFSGQSLTSRYELVVAVEEPTGQPVVESEAVRLRTNGQQNEISDRQRRLFPDTALAPKSILMKQGPGRRHILSKKRDGATNFYAETNPSPGKGWVINLKLSPQKSALANLPEDEDKFPIATWLKQLLIEGVQPIMLDGITLRSASPPNRAKHFMTDASNLPWVIEEFQKFHRPKFEQWLLHLRESLPTLTGIDTIEREWDRFRYLLLEYDDGLKIPSWMASDGTLRLLALTLPAYLPNIQGVFLIEEPENGIHPKAVETLYEALSSVYGAQILIATHSPVLLGLVDPSKVLCFARNSEGATDIVRGDEHPMLSDWQENISLQDYFVSGVLG